MENQVTVTMEVRKGEWSDHIACNIPISMFNNDPKTVMYIFENMARELKRQNKRTIKDILEDKIKI